MNLEPGAGSVVRNPEPSVGSIPRNLELIAPCLRTKEKVCLNTPVGSKARRNELSDGLSDSWERNPQWVPDSRERNSRLAVLYTTTLSILVRNHEN